MIQKCEVCKTTEYGLRYHYRKSLDGLICAVCVSNEEYERKEKNKEKSRKRRAELQEAAERDGFEKASEAITAWKNEEYILISVDRLRHLEKKIDELINRYDDPSINRFFYML